MTTIEAMELAAQNECFPRWLRDACAAAGKDSRNAERYLKLRHLMNSGDGRDGVTALACIVMETAEQMDAAVDAARELGAA